MNIIKYIFYILLLYIIIYYTNINWILHKYYLNITYHIPIHIQKLSYSETIKNESKSSNFNRLILQWLTASHASHLEHIPNEVWHEDNDLAGFSESAGAGVISKNQRFTAENSWPIYHLYLIYIWYVLQMHPRYPR